MTCDRAAIDVACARFTGRIEQRPPRHSALKHLGKSLYAYARAGVEVERAARPVEVHRIDIVDWHSPRLVVDVICSKGTYIRTLAEAIGDALGCGAHLAALRRTGAGGLDIAQAITVDALAALDEAARVARLLPVDVLLSDWPAVCLPDDEAGRFLTGLRRRVALDDAPAVRVYASTPPPTAAGVPNPRAFLGAAHIACGELVPDRLLSPLEVQARNA